MNAPGPPHEDAGNRVVGCRDAPPEVRSYTTLAKVDYVDRFTITTNGASALSAEEWLRAALEATPTGRSAPILWRAIGLRLGPRPSPDHVQGWRIVGQEHDWVTVEAPSWYVTAQAVCDVDQRNISISLFLQYEAPLAAALWAPVSVLHRRAVPNLLRQAVAGAARRGATREEQASRETDSRSDATGDTPQ